MELVHASVDQPKRYAFYVDLLPLDACIKVIKWAVRDYHESCVDQEDDNVETQDADRGGPALKVLLAVFQDREEFGDNEAAAEYLGSLDSADDPRALSRMLAWTNEIHKKLSAHVSKGPMSASTATELAELVGPFIQGTESPMIHLDEYESLECCVWPFVRLAR